MGNKMICVYLECNKNNGTGKCKGRSDGTNPDISKLDKGLMRCNDYCPEEGD